MLVCEQEQVPHPPGLLEVGVGDVTLRVREANQPSLDVCWEWQSPEHWTLVREPDPPGTFSGCVVGTDGDGVVRYYLA